MTAIDSLTVRIEADTSGLRGALESASQAVAKAGNLISATLPAMEAPFAALRNTIDHSRQSAGSLEQFLPDLENALKRIASASKEIGDKIGKAFEDAVFSGKSLREVLRGLAQDLARIAFKKAATEPLAEWVTDQIKVILGGSGRGGGLSAGGSVFIPADFPLPLPGFAAGGRPPVGRPALVGERGPELFVPDVAGAIVPHHALGAGGNLTIAYSIDARGAEAGVESRIRAALRESEARTLAAVRALADRGGAFARALGRR
jgi:hypothetical protein